MKRLLLLLIFGLLVLPGCDVAAVALLMSSQDDGSDDDDPLASPPPETVARVYVAQIADANAADQEELNLVAADGRPGSIWKELGIFTATDIFDPNNATLGAFNCILITASSSVSYELDSVEIIDANQNAVEYAATPVWSNQMTTPDNIAGSPNGVPAVTNAQGTSNAFIFMMFTTNPIDRFRLNGHPPSAPAPGDIVGVGGYQSFGSERPGGMAIDVNGLVHLTISVGDVGRLVRYDLTGSFALPVDNIEISPDLATAGIHSVALNSAGEVFTSCSNGSGLVQVRKFDSNLTSVSAVGFSSGFNGDRVEHNSIAVDGSGNIIVVGGQSSLTSGRNHWRVKIPPIITDPPIWQSNSAMDVGSSSTTYWHAVTTGANDQVYMAGDRLSAVIGGTNQVYTGVFNAAAPGGAIWDQDYDQGDAAADIGHSIALDAAGNTYVAGSVGTATDRDGVLLRYAPMGASFIAFEFPGAAGMDEEILDMAVDTDGSIYLVGYENTSAQGENWLIRKVMINQFNQFITQWQKTYHGGFGNDRAVSVALFGNSVVVAGYEENASAQTKLMLRVYEK